MEGDVGATGKYGMYAPTIFFIARDTGAHDYFAVPLADAL